MATRDGTFGTDQEAMWREHPSMPAECWQQSTEGTYYAQQLALARGQGRICTVPHVQHVPVNTFWDIGSGDGTGIWFHQHIHPGHHFLRYIEGWGEPYAFFTKQMDEMGYSWGTHYLPHDATADLIGTWCGENNTPCLVLVPSRRRMSHENTEPAILRLPNAWIYSDDVGDPVAAAEEVFGMIQAMGMTFTALLGMRVLSLIRDHLEDLVKMPPKPDGIQHVVAEMMITDEETGKERLVEVRGDV
jgi:hypothetical protein